MFTSIEGNNCLLYSDIKSIFGACRAYKLTRRLSNVILICRFRIIFQGLHRKRRRHTNIVNVTLSRPRLSKTSLALNGKKLEFRVGLKGL